MLRNLFKNHVRGTEKKALVPIVESLLCHPTIAVAKGINVEVSKVYISTRVIKHIYDKRTAEEFDFLLGVIPTIVKYPDKVYRNKSGKRGELCFVKTVKNQKCLCSIEQILIRGKPSHFETVTFFRTEDSYLAKYELLWEWKGGTPSS
jgi:hypothetical protein